MIINWKKTNIKVIPVVGSNKLITSTVNLLPGMNDIPENIWMSVRKLVKDEIERGLIEEVQTKVTVETKKVKNPETNEEKEEKVEKVQSKELKDIPPKEASEIVKDTYDLKTLNKWLDDEGRSDVRAVLQNQIDHVEKYGRDKRKKSKQKRKEDR